MSGLWADEAGEAGRPLIVVIHGSMDRSAGMLKLSRQLDDNFRVLRYDRRGYGRSFPHPGPFVMDAQVDDLVGLLAGRRAVLVGHSYGGNVALAAAEQHPDVVCGVAAYETPLSWEPWWPTTTAGSAAVADAGTTEDAAERFMRRILGDQRWDALPERSKQTRRSEGAAMVSELADLRRNRPWTAGNVHVPVVVAFGSRGAAHHRQGMTHAARLLDCPLVELADCRHDAPLSDPVLFRSLVVDPLLRMVGTPWSSCLRRLRPLLRQHAQGMETSMSEPRNVHVTSLVSPKAARALTLPAQSSSEVRWVQTPNASPATISTLISLVVTFLISQAINTMITTRPRATAIPMFFAPSTVIDVMNAPYA